VALCAALTLVPLGLLAYLSVHLATGAVEDNAKAQVRSNAALAVNLFASGMMNVKTSMAAFAARQQLQAAVGGPTVDRAALHQQLLKLKNEQGSTAAAFFVTPDGRLVEMVPTAPALRGADLSESDWYQGMQVSGQPYVSAAYRSEAPGRANAIAVAVPVRAGSGNEKEINGILVATFDLTATQEFVDYFSSSLEIDFALTDQNGVLLARPGHKSGALVSLEDDPGVVTALNGGTSFREQDSDRGHLLSAYAPIPGVGWTIAASVPREQAFAEVDRLRSTVLVVAGLLGLVLLAGLAFLARSLRQRERAEAELEESHEQLRELVLRDALTGLLNHRAFQERLGQELDRARREDYPVSLVALDVDNLKEINDSTGHAAGDEALRLLSQALLSRLRPSDICGRVGGDEFVIALPKVDVQQAEEIVARFLSAASAIAVGPARTFVTISAGIAGFPGHTTEQADLMRLADGAMYWSKRRGRNRYSVYEPESGDALSPQEDVDQIRRKSLVNTVYALAVAVDAKDGYTYLHSERVAHYAATLAGSIRLPRERIELIRTAGLLHDVGKIGISDAILLKPGKLTTEEATEMERHSSLGRDIIAGAGMAEIAHWVLHLHERFDGSGYPDGLTGSEIPLESRVLLVADALEAMTSSRIYRGALPVADALLELERASGTQLDPWLASEMVALIRTGRLMVGELCPVADDIQPQPIDEPAWIDELARRRTS